METTINGKMNSSPDISYNSEGMIEIKGRALSQDSRLDFKPAIDWCKSQKFSEVLVIIKLEYMNADSVRQLIDMFRTLDINLCVESIKVKWYVDEDSDISDTGYMFQEIFPHISFLFKNIEIRKPLIKKS